MSSPVRGSRSLIPGLPDEVVLIILARLPRALYGNLCRVCYAWRDALRSSSAMTALRNSLHISEMWTVLRSQGSITLYDPLLRHHSSPIPYFREPRFLLGRAGAVGSQVCFVHEEEGIADIRCFDASSMPWQVDSIPLWGKKASVKGVACSVVDGHLWLVGEGADARATMRLDVKSRRWEKMPKMHEGRVRAAAVVLDGRLHVIGGRSTSGGNMVHSGEIWDPSMGEWILQPELWSHPLHIFWEPEVVVVMDTLYALKGYKDVELIHYVSKSKIWASLGHLPLEKYRCSCGDGRHPRLAGVGRELWVVLNCESGRTICTAKILSCVPATGSLPLLWRSVSNKFPPGYVIVNGQVHV